MPWGWECRAKLIKQTPSKPTEKRGPISCESQAPAPNHYEAPQIFCGKGISNIKRAPAYTFGHCTPVTFAKPASKPNAPLFNLRGLNRKGCFRVTHSVVTPQIEPPQDHLIVPGPGAYKPRHQISYKRPPAYSLRAAAKPPYEPWDMWTPSPNMYCPQKPLKKAPAYTLGYQSRQMTASDIPGPGAHDPKFEYIDKTKPAVSFGRPFKPAVIPQTPAPNAYCEKKLMVNKKTIPAPSFGIRHSPYIGQQEQYLRISNHELKNEDF